MARIQAVFGDFVGYRDNGSPPPGADSPRTYINSAIYTHVHACGACGLRVRFTGQRIGRRKCGACGHTPLDYVGEVRRVRGQWAGSLCDRELCIWLERTSVSAHTASLPDGPGLRSSTFAASRLQTTWQ